MSFRLRFSIAAFFIAASAAAFASPQMKANAVLLGDCSRKVGDSASSTPCGGAVVSVVFQDGFMSFQFHSAERNEKGRYREVFDFVGPTLTPAGADKSVAALRVTEMHFMDGTSETPVQKPYADAQCELKFAGKDFEASGVRKIVCSYRDGQTLNEFTLDNVKPGSMADLKTR